MLGVILNDGTPIKSVEVKIDEGPWQPATIDPATAKEKYGWKLFTYSWSWVTPGEHTIVSRVTDARAEVQPTEKELENKKTFLEDNSQHPRRFVVQAVESTGRRVAPARPINAPPHPTALMTQPPVPRGDDGAQRAGPGRRREDCATPAPRSPKWSRRAAIPSQAFCHGWYRELHEGITVEHLDLKSAEGAARMRVAALARRSLPGQPASFRAASGSASTPTRCWPPIHRSTTCAG